MNARIHYFISDALQGLPLFLAIALFASNATATLVVNLPWLRVSADATRAEIFMRIRSSDATTLTSVTTFAANSAIIVAPTGKKSPEGITLPAGVDTELTDKGYRILLTGVARTFKQGERVPVTLVFTAADGTRQEVLITAEVRKRSALEDEGTPHHQHQHK